MSSVQLWNTTSPSVPPPLFLFNHHQYLRLNINLHHPRRLIIITTILPSIFCPTVPLICYHRPLKPTSGHGTSPLSHELTNHHQHNNLHKNGTINIFSAITNNRRSRCYSAIAIDAPSSLTDSPPIRWGSVSLQGPREEMEDDILLRPDCLQGYSFAAVFDGHGGFASVEFLRFMLG